jgi:stage III sporulation protein SpoIIIAA
MVLFHPTTGGFTPRCVRAQAQLSCVAPALRAASDLARGCAITAVPLRAESLVRATRSVLHTATPAPPPARAAPATEQEVRRLLAALPVPVQQALAALEQAAGHDVTSLVELNVQIGRWPEAVFVAPDGSKRREMLVQAPCTAADVALFREFFIGKDGVVAAHKRAGMPGTLHRLSCTTHPSRGNEVLAVTARVGRALEGVVDRMAPFLLESDASLLLIGVPGVGKTTLLRELARRLSDDRRLTVVVVDKTCEIGGDGDAPHPSIGSARWMPVGRPGLQAAILREAVENQSPDIIICDEISTSEEVEAARTIAQRGVRLIATVHGGTLPELVNDGERRNLVGGQGNVTLTGSAAERRPDRRKSVAVRLREPPFGAALELHGRERWVWHPSVREAVDAYFSGEPVRAQLLEPGRRIALTAVPEADAFTYCLECGRLDKPCPAHTPPPPPPPTERGGGFAGPRRSGNMQFSGACYGCGEPGHIRMNCPNQQGRGGGGFGGGAAAGLGAFRL